MFNNWLKRKDDESKEEVASKNVQDKNNPLEKEDDYYYYYYYESSNDGEPTIPNLNVETKEKEQGNTENKANASSLGGNEAAKTVVASEMEEVHYEEDYEQASLGHPAPLTEQRVKTLEDKNKQLNNQLKELDADNQKLIKEIERLSSDGTSHEGLSDKHSETLKEKEELEEKIQQSENQLEEANQLVEKLQNEKVELETINADLVQENDKSKALIETLKSENNVFANKIEELQEEINHSKQNSTNEALILAENKRIIEELENELKQSKDLETELIKKHEDMIEANELLMTKKEQELKNMSEKLNQTEELEKELSELKENQKAIQELQQELSNMRQQQAEVTANLNELASEKSRATVLEKEVSDLKSIQTVSNNDLQAELIRVKEELRLANAKAEQYTSMNQSDIAQVMLEAQAKARQIVDVANYEAKRRIADSEMELSAVSQEARNYYRKLEKLKAESESVFSDLLRKLESIGDIDKL